jgi:hypothetical protein
MRRAIWLLLLAASIVGCSSPERTRTRGGGPGADVGNRPTVVKMHEGSRQYWKTPVMIRGDGPSLAAAEHARSVSLEKHQ